MVPLQHPMKQYNSSEGATIVRVTLILSPVLARWTLTSNAELRLLCLNVLSTLAAVHSQGFVHRDVRAGNVMKDIGSFRVIDWELASKIGGVVFWRAPEGRLPPGIHIGDAWEPWMDMWQLGLLLQEQKHVATPESNAFVRDLMAKKFISSEKALESIW